MNDQHQIESLHAQQASAWVEALRQPTAVKRAAFVAWLKESPRNVRDFLSMYALDQALNQFDAASRHDIQELLSQADDRVVRVTDRFARLPHPRVIRHTWRRSAIAAGVALLGVLVVLLVQRDNWQELNTVSGEQRTFELADGSIVHLNTRTRVEYRFSRGVRNLKLIEGEALFKVHHDSSAPFRVHAGRAVIQAVGTQFAVYAKPEGTEVSVIEGLVRVSSELRNASSSSDATVEARQSEPTTFDLAASEVAQINPAGTVSVRTVADVTDSIAWRERRLVFREDTLASIIHEFNRYNKEQITLETAEIGSRIYTGVFDADDPESFIEVLIQESDLAVDRLGNDILVRGK